MLKVKAMQMRALGGASRERFEQESVALLRGEFPKTTSAHSDEVLRKFVALGIERARAHGVVAVTDVERWLRLMVRLGPKFDQDSRYAPLRAILADRDSGAQQRMDALEAAAAQLSEARK